MNIRLIEDDGTKKIVDRVKAKIAAKDSEITTLRAEKEELLQVLDNLIQIDFVYDLGESAEYTGSELKQFLAARKAARDVIAKVK